MRMLYRDVAQLGRALRWGRRGRGFESRHPDVPMSVNQPMCDIGRPRMLVYGYWLNLAERSVRDGESPGSNPGYPTHEKGSVSRERTTGRGLENRWG